MNNAVIEHFEKILYGHNVFISAHPVTSINQNHTWWGFDIIPINGNTLVPYYWSSEGHEKEHHHVLELEPIDGYTNALHQGIQYYYKHIRPDEDEDEDLPQQLY